MMILISVASAKAGFASKKRNTLPHGIVFLLCIAALEIVGVQITSAEIIQHGKVCAFPL